MAERIFVPPGTNSTAFTLTEPMRSWLAVLHALYPEGRTRTLDLFDLERAQVEAKQLSRKLTLPTRLYSNPVNSGNLSGNLDSRPLPKLSS